MDYHFIIPKETGKKKRNLSVLIVPVLLISAILPFVLAYIVTPRSFTFLSQANDKSELRIWITPARVLAHSGDTVTLTVKASFDGGSELIPSLRFQVDGTNVNISQKSFVYAKPFRGEVTIGEFTATVLKSGSVTLGVPIESIKIDPPLNDVNIKASSVVFVVQ